MARLRPVALDEQLAAGADPSQSARVAARAAQLTRRKTRAQLATALERLTAAQASRVRIRASRTAVRVNGDRMLALAQSLRSSEPVYAGGVASLELLLRDGAGPLYCDPHGEALARWLDLIQTRLRG